MEQILLDETLRARLNGFDRHLELRDPEGLLIGHFLPDRLYLQLLYANDQCPYTAEELRKHMEEPGGRSLADIWRRVGRP